MHYLKLVQSFQGSSLYRTLYNALSQAWNGRVLMWNVHGIGIYARLHPEFQNQYHCNCVSDASVQSHDGVQCTIETRNPEMTAPTSNHLRTPKEQMFILHRQELSTFNPEQSPRHLLYHIASWQARGAHSLPTVQ